MTNALCYHLRRMLLVAVLAGMTWPGRAPANPVLQGTAPQGVSVGSSGSQFTINQSTPYAFINWSSFNINANETTTFNQPSATSVTWNYISDPSASAINGNLNANGYLILQNPNGFTVGGSAVITAHGLVMTTASTPALNLAGGGAWAFDAPPPGIAIKNLGTINITGGGSAFLIADTIVNGNENGYTGTISAPGGRIGLYAGQQVLVSMSPDGRGLSAKVTLPQGSVDNEGNLKADAGSIILQAAQVVNQGGLIQANTAQNVNGVIELLAGDSVSLQGNSQITANGGNQGAGGSVQIQSGNTFSDQAGSSIDVSGGIQGGAGGSIAISAPQMSAVQSSLTGQAAAGYASGSLSLDTANITLNGDGSPVAGALALNVNSLSSGFSQIKLQAANNIDVNAQWTLAPESGIIDWVSLFAGNAITLESGSKIAADAGRIVLSAPNVTSAGTLQANSVGTANGAVEVDASQSLALNNGSAILANGDSSSGSPSPGGFVVLHAPNSFSDTAGSTISVSGNAVGGQGGIVELFPGSGGTYNSAIIGSPYAVLVNPTSLTLSSGVTDPTIPNLNLAALLNYSQVCLYNIELASMWNLGTAGSPSTLNLSAMNNLTVDDSAGIVGNNWNLNLSAGTSFTGTTPPSGQDGIYLNGSAFLQTTTGNINLWAADEVQVSGGGIGTIGGGNINVTAEYGDVNSGTSTAGFTYLPNAPFFTPVSPGGISTAAGGNVTINAGGDVISLSASTVAAGDPGTGTFGSQPGNVTINAGGNVYGHFVEVNGNGTINAGGDIGTSDLNVALSLVTGNWNLNAGWDPALRTVQTGIGDIYLQEVRNPNGVFNNTMVTLRGRHVISSGYHLFTYDPHDTLTLDGGNGVYLTGNNLPRPNDAVPLLLPPTVDLYAGPGGVTLDVPTAFGGNNNPVAISQYITMFPSAYGNLQIVTTDGGGFFGVDLNGTAPGLLMSDSGQTRWISSSSFTMDDHANVPAELNNYTPVEVNISGDMDNVSLQVCKQAQITVDGNMNGCTFFGENLHAGDVTSITVGGQIAYQSTFTTVNLDTAFPDALELSRSLPNGDSFLPLHTIDTWYTILFLALDPTKLPTDSLSSDTPAQLAAAISGALEFPSLYINSSTVDYNPTTKALSVAGSMTPDLLNVLLSPTLTLLIYGANGSPLLDSNGHLEIQTIPWVQNGSANYNLINSLFANSQGKPPLQTSGGLIVGGTGTFDVTAGSIDLGNSAGILSVGNGTVPGYSPSYYYLTPYITSGATINVTADYLEMPISLIATLGGGDVNVNCTGAIPGSAGSGSPGVSMDLGSLDLADFEGYLMARSNLGLGIYTSAGGNVNVAGVGTINIDTSRIATFDGGNIFIESYTGSVNAGSGSTTPIPVTSYPINTPLGTPPYEYVFANGIVADTLAPGPDDSLVPGAPTQPGNITVITPQGDIVASQGGILQETLNGTLEAGPSITLEAGTPAGGDWSSTAPPVYVGNVKLDNSGVIGGTVNVKATGKVSGLVISSQNANITSQTAGSLTVLAAGIANVAVSGGSGPGITIIGGQGVNASGLGTGALLLGQNVSVNGGAAQSTLGSSASATSTSQSAASQTSNEGQEQAAATGNSDDDEKKKKKPVLRHIGRVTVILSAAVPAR